ncbi:MAG: hypothetical protein ACREJB_19375 [Planctomycetaceae bacterium]
MTTDQLIEELRQLSNADRLRVIEAATELIRRELPQTPRQPAPPGKPRLDNPLLKVGGSIGGEPPKPGEIDRVLYGEATDD